MTKQPVTLAEQEEAAIAGIIPYLCRDLEDLRRDYGRWSGDEPHILEHVLTLMDFAQRVGLYPRDRSGNPITT